MSISADTLRVLGSGTPEKDTMMYSWLTLIWVIALSVWGGIANYVRKVKNGLTHRFNLTELAGEMVVSGFSGFVTFLLCDAGDIGRVYSYALAGISGHMGSRALLHLEHYLSQKFR